MGTQDCHHMYVLADPRLFNLSTRGVTPRQRRLTSLMVIGRRRAVEAATAESGTGQDNYCLAVDPPTSAAADPPGSVGARIRCIGTRRHGAGCSLTSPTGTPRSAVYRFEPGLRLLKLGCVSGGV